MKWRRRLGLWILSFDRGLQHWWKWLRSMGFDPESPVLIARSQNSSGCTSDTLPGRIPTPSPPPGRSWHNYGLAMDLVSTDNAWLGAVWRHWGGFWTPSDAVHFGAYG